MNTIEEFLSVFDENLKPSRVEEAREYLTREKYRIAREEGTRARDDWSQFFPGLIRLEVRCLCATLEAIAHTKKP